MIVIVIYSNNNKNNNRHTVPQNCMSPQDCSSSARFSHLSREIIILPSGYVLSYIYEIFPGNAQGFNCKKPESKRKVLVLACET